MSDEALRLLERRAATGDDRAKRELRRERWRRGEDVGLEIGDVVEIRPRAWPGSQLADEEFHWTWHRVHDEPVRARVMRVATYEDDQHPRRRTWPSLVDCSECVCTAGHEVNSSREWVLIEPCPEEVS